MIDFLVKNKEWLFSGVGVVIMGLIFSVFRNRIFSPKARIATPIVQDISQPLPGNPDQLTPSATPQIKKTNSIELEEIVAALRESPPLQKSDLIKHYIGLTVQWETLLWSAEKSDGDNVLLTLHFGSQNLSLVHCSVLLSDYKELGVMKRNAPITVIGKISKVSTSSADLDNVQLIFDRNSRNTG
ncbi:MAG: hypothetical protein ABL934_17850 [Lysobacteraceae bacterium]